ncbi:ABC transporter ATP-binding protein [Bradyrhizobium sp. dw_411]|uniref:ABC transporter ATP-binding protein n=1 Tax=Bradyrhizobium sp. dw_411 TaxID=2720082 RepID=UPI001BCF0E06|nr:ABC transporter ATP-binding protein [Bradyrhizobium sp. dw_411]
MSDPGTRISDQQSLRRGKIEIRGLTKQFGDSDVYRDFNLDLQEGEFVSIFGPNGCGKSTFINLISGIIPIDFGTVLYDGKTIAQTRLSYVFQNYREALFPWMRAISNIQYPLKILGLDKKTQSLRVEALLAEFNIKIDLNRYPYELSGGQQQMVSILRALITDPEVLFLDEPFSALDYEMTLFMRERLQHVFLKRRNTMILVSHDLEEAVQLANRVLMLTRRPTRIADTVPVDVPWPRDAKSLTSPEFVAIKSRCLEVFSREVARHDSAGAASGSG